MADSRDLFSRNTYDRDTQTYTDTSGQKYSMAESVAAERGSTIVSSEPSITKKKSSSSSSNKGSYIKDSQTYVSSTGETQSMAESVAAERGARVFNTVKDYQDYNYAQYKEAVRSLQEKEMPSVVEEEISKNINQQLNTQIGQVYKTTDYKGDTTYAPVSGTTSTYNKPINMPTNIKIQEYEDKFKSLGFGFILQKDFYLPTDEAKTEFKKVLTSGNKGNIYNFQKESIKQYEEDKQNYSRQYLVYTTNPNTTNLNKLNNLANRLNSIKTGNQVINTDFKDDKLVQSYKYAGYTQKYGTKLLGEAGLVIGTGAIAPTLGIAGKVAPSVKKLTAARNTALVLGVAGGGLEGYTTYKRTGDIEQAIIAGVGQTLFVGLPIAADINTALKFRKALDDLKQASVFSKTDDIIKTTDGKFVIQGRSGRIGTTLKQDVMTNIIIDPTTNKVVYGTANSVIINRNTGKIVAKNTYFIDNILTKELNSIIPGMKKYATGISYMDLANNKKYFDGILSYSTKIMNNQYSFFDTKIDEFIKLKNGKLTTSAENIKNVGISSTSVSGYSGLSSSDFMDPAVLSKFYDFQIPKVKTSKSGLVSDMLGFSSTVPSITPKVVPEKTTGIITDLLVPTTTKKALDFGSLTVSATQATVGVMDVFPQVVDSSMLLINPLLAPTANLISSKTTMTHKTIEPVEAIGVNNTFANLLTTNQSFTQPTKQQSKTSVKSTQSLFQNLLLNQQVGQDIKSTQIQRQPQLIQQSNIINQQQMDFTSQFINSPIINPIGIGGFNFPGFNLGGTTSKKKKNNIKKNQLNAFPTLFQTQILGERKARYPKRRYTGFEVLR